MERNVVFDAELLDHVQIDAEYTDDIHQRDGNQADPRGGEDMVPAKPRHTDTAGRGIDRSLTITRRGAFRYGFRHFDNSHMAEISKHCTRTLPPERAE